MSNSSVTKIEFSASPENCSVVKLHSKFFAFLLLLLLNGSINADALEPINIQGPSCADMGMVNVGGVCQNPGGGGFGGGSGGGGGGFGSGGGGGGGIGFGRPIPNNPNNTERGANCSSIESVRMNYARQEVGPFLSSLDIGDFVKIRYVSNGQRETFEIICKICSIPAVPIPGTCGG